MKNHAESLYFAGIDIGSTTAKAVILDKEGGMVFFRYCRHQGKTVETTRRIFNDALEKLGDVELDLAVTGSAGGGGAAIFWPPVLAGEGGSPPPN